MTTTLAASSRPAPSPAPPHQGVVDWLAAVADGRDLMAALQQVRAEALASVPLHLWIHLCPHAVWAAQIDLLTTRLHSSADRTELLRRFPF
jgi:hypothetical protein